MTSLPINPNPQLEFDYQVGHMRPWLLVEEVASASMLSCDSSHVVNLIDDGSIDAAIDIRRPGVERRCIRILRDSAFRFLHDRKGTPTNLEERINFYLASTRIVYASHEIASHLRCSEDHVLNLKNELSLDISSAGSQRSYPRTSRKQLIEFIIKRRIQ